MAPIKAQNLLRTTCVIRSFIAAASTTQSPRLPGAQRAGPGEFLQRAPTTIERLAAEHIAAPDPPGWAEEGRCGEESKLAAAARAA